MFRRERLNAWLRVRNLMRKRIHGPADAHANQEKQQKSPQDVLYAVHGPPTAEETKGDGNYQCKDHQRLEMAKLHCDHCIKQSD